MMSDRIPHEAVEAAAKICLERADGYKWVDFPEEERIGMRQFVRPLLEAAAPYMLAGAWEEAIEAYKAWTWDDENMDPLANPYMLNNEGEK